MPQDLAHLGQRAAGTVHRGRGGVAKPVRVDLAQAGALTGV